MLRIGLLVSSPMASKYAVDLAVWAREQDDLDMSALVVCGEPSKPSGLATLFWKPILAVERRLLRGSRFYRDHYTRFDLSTLVPTAIPADAATLTSARLDVLVRLHPAPFDQGLIGAARLGLVDLDPMVRADRAAPTMFGAAGFWPCFRRSAQTPFAVRRQVAGEARSELCASGAFATEWCFSLNQAALLAKSVVYLKDTLKRLAAGAPAADRRDIAAESPDPPPGAAAVVSYGARLVWRELRRLTIRFRGLRQRWSISLGAGALDGLDPARMTPIPSPPGKFWADPFLWSRDGKTYCFVEEFPYQTRRGHISALEVGGNGVTDLGPVVKEDFHLSFPFLFEHDGQLFMIPESCEARQVRLYVCEEFPLRWRLHSILMDDVPAADTMVFPRDGRWWLITTFDRAGVNDYCNELNLYSADSPLSQRWTPHPLNPLKIDSFGGRNAGMLLRDGPLYRFAQRQGFDQYGEGLMIFAVEELTPSTYRETLIREILPDFGKGILGTHHLSIRDGMVVTDRVRWDRVRPG